jgi:uncharacterized protein YoxC
VLVTGIAAALLSAAYGALVIYEGSIKKANEALATMVEVTKKAAHDGLDVFRKAVDDATGSTTDFSQSVNQANNNLKDFTKSANGMSNAAKDLAQSLHGPVSDAADKAAAAWKKLADAVKTGREEFTATASAAKIASSSIASSSESAAHSASGGGGGGGGSTGELQGKYDWMAFPDMISMDRNYGKGAGALSWASFYGAQGKALDSTFQRTA